MAELMIDVRNTYAEKLTQEKLFEWHRMLIKGSRWITSAAIGAHAGSFRIQRERKSPL